MLGRRRLPAGLEAANEAFEAVLRQVEPAKAALARVMPTTRAAGGSLPEALLEFEARLEVARTAMPGWRRRETDDVWRACRAGLDEAFRRSRRLREEAPDLGGFEGLIWLVDGLLSPLEPFEAAARRFRDLRTRKRRPRVV